MRPWASFFAWRGLCATNIFEKEKVNTDSCNYTLVDASYFKMNEEVLRMLQFEYKVNKKTNIEVMGCHDLD